VSLSFHVIPDWFELVSLACCIGVLVCSPWVVGSARGDAISAQEDLLAGMRHVLRISAAALFVSCILGLLVRSAEMSGYPITGVLPALPTVLLRTHYGHAWLLRMAAIVALSATIAAARAPHPSGLSRWFMLGCAVVVSAMDSASGHASDAGDFSAAEILDWLHLIAALVWGGGLLVLSTVILPRFMKQGDRAAWSMAGIATRFSGIAGVGVGLVALTASYQWWAYGGSVDDLVRSPFGRTITSRSSCSQCCSSSVRSIDTSACRACKSGRAPRPRDSGRWVGSSPLCCYPSGETRVGRRPPHGSRAPCSSRPS